MSGTNSTANLVCIGPSIILVEPQLGENIGMAARAMANFGLHDLRLVNPRESWPNEKASSASSGADHIIDKVQVFDKLEDAIADKNYVIATTARARHMVKPAYDAEIGAEELRKRELLGSNCAVLFGRERWGLNNHEIALSDAIMSYPVNPGFASLNIAQAVLIFSYAYIRAHDQVPEPTGGSLLNDVAAPKQDLIGMFNHLEDELDEAHFFKTAEKREGMIRNLRNMFSRVEFTAQEVRTMRGVIKALTHYHPNRKKNEG